MLVFFNYLSAQTDEDQVRLTMNQWKQAIVAQDIDKIVSFYSDKFRSMDGDGKEGVRQMWTEIKELGYSGTGRKYGVSDNSIRKWKKYYELNI